MGIALHLGTRVESIAAAVASSPALHAPDGGASSARPDRERVNRLLLAPNPGP